MKINYLIELVGYATKLSYAFAYKYYYYSGSEYPNGVDEDPSSAESTVEIKRPLRLFLFQNARPR